MFAASGFPHKGGLKAAQRNLKVASKVPQDLEAQPQNAHIIEGPQCKSDLNAAPKNPKGTTQHQSTTEPPNIQAWSLRYAK